MAAKLTASESQMLKNQVEFLQMKLSSSDQQHQVQLLQIRQSSADSNIETLKRERDGNYNTMMFRECGRLDIDLCWLFNM